jgi:hypothetical protein
MTVPQLVLSPMTFNRKIEFKDGIATPHREMNFLDI